MSKFDREKALEVAHQRVWARSHRTTCWANGAEWYHETVVNVIADKDETITFALKTLEIAKNQLLGVSLAVKEHGQNINPSFFITEYQKMADAVDEAIAEIKAAQS